MDTAGDSGDRGDTSGSGDSGEWAVDLVASENTKQPTTQRCSDNVSSGDFRLFATQRKIRITISTKSKKF
jgi:hypothetical protein